MFSTVHEVAMLHMRGAVPVDHAAQSLHRHRLDSADLPTTRYYYKHDIVLLEVTKFASSFGRHSLVCKAACWLQATFKETLNTPLALGV